MAAKLDSFGNGNYKGAGFEKPPQGYQTFVVRSVKRVTTKKECEKILEDELRSDACVGVRVRKDSKYEISVYCWGYNWTKQKANHEMCLEPRDFDKSALFSLAFLVCLAWGCWAAQRV